MAKFIIFFFLMIVSVAFAFIPQRTEGFVRKGRDISPHHIGHHGHLGGRGGIFAGRPIGQASSAESSANSGSFRGGSFSNAEANSRTRTFG